MENDKRKADAASNRVFEKTEESTARERRLSPQERTRCAVVATRNKWAMENFNATHN